MKIDWQHTRTKIIAALGCLVFAMWAFNILLLPHPTQHLIALILTFIFAVFFTERIAAAAYKRLRSSPPIRRKFAFWALVLVIYAVITAPWYNDRPFRAVIFIAGFFLNLFLTVFYRPWMVRPIIKVFSDDVHKRITEAMVTVQGIFFIVFQWTVGLWRAYMLEAHPDFVAFLHKIFG